MAESTKKDNSSLSVNGKDALEDLDIGKDFFSWADGAALDFDFPPASKGNTPASKGKKKAFAFDKADLDFNFDDDFGGMSSFKVDMSDFNVSPPLKRDGNSKDKSKESSSGKDAGASFDMDIDISPPLKRGDKSKEKSKDSSSGAHAGSSLELDMPELDISSPFKKDGNSKEKSKESSSRNDRRKNDCFSLEFGFDEMDNLGFGSSLTKEDSGSREDKNMGKDSRAALNVITSMSNLDDGSQKPSSPEARVNLDVGCLVEGSAYLEPTRTCSLNLAMDDAVIREQSAAIIEAESDKTEVLLEKTVVLREPSNNNQSFELFSHGTDDLEACTGNNATKELSSDYPSNNEPGRSNSSEAQNKVDSMCTNATGSNGEQDANMIVVVDSTSTLSKKTQRLQTVPISEYINAEESLCLVEDHETDNRGKTELGQINSLVENPSTASAVLEVLLDSQSGRKNLESSGILRQSLVGQPVSLEEKQDENERESLVKSSLPSIPPEKSECPPLKVSTQAKFSSFNSKRMGLAQPSLVGGRRDGHTSQSDKKLVSVSLQHPKAPLRGEPPYTQSQGNCNTMKTSGEMGNVDGLQNRKNINVSFETQIKHMVITKPTMNKTETSTKDLDSLSMLHINKKAAINRETITLTSIPTKKNNPLGEHRRSSTEGSTAPDLSNLKLTGLKLDSTKSPIQRETKSVGNSSQKSTLIIKKACDVAHFPNTLKRSTVTLSMKRTLEDAAANSISLLPSKRPTLSASTSRNLVETSEEVLNRKVISCDINVPSQSQIEDARVISTTNDCQTICLPNLVHNKGMEVSLSIQNDNNVKGADAYSKKLNDLCNIIRKKHDEAKEILARAIVNSNKLLLLNSPSFQEKPGYDCQIDARQRWWTVDEVAEIAIIISENWFGSPYLVSTMI